jgi:hypothetical protein
MSTSKNSSTTLFASDTKLVAGLQQNEATLPPMTILGQAYSKPFTSGVVLRS